MLLDYVVNYDARKPLSLEEEEINSILSSMSDAIKIKPSLKKDFERALKYSNFVEIFGGSSKLLFDNGITKEAKSIKLQLMVEDFISGNYAKLKPLFTAMEDIINSTDIMKNLRFRL